MNAYETLGLESTASDDEIKKAYRKMALKYHPDRNQDPQAESKFKEVSEAYSILGDPQKKAMLDASLHMGNAGRRYQRDPIFDHFFRNGGLHNAGWEDLFGSPWSQPGAQRRTATLSVELSLEEAYQGVKRVVNIDDNSIDIHIPPGVRSGETLHARVDHNLEIHISVKIRPHPTFQRKGNDLHARLDIPLIMAIEGGEMLVPTVSGENINLRIPACLNSHAKLRVKGAGMRNSSGDAGHAYFEVRIVVPELDSVERNLLAGILSRNQSAS